MPTWLGVPWRLKVTTAKTAKIARKSPKMLTICAIHRLRTGRMARTSRKDRAVAGGDMVVAPPLGFFYDAANLGKDSTFCCKPPLRDPRGCSRAAMCAHGQGGMPAL